MELEKIIRDIGLVGISNILISISSIIFLPVLTKNLSAEEYGYWVQLYASLGMMMSFFSLGLPYAMTRIFPERRQHQKIIRRDFSTIFFSTLIISSIVALFIFIFPNILLIADDYSIIRLFSLIFLIYMINSVLLAVFRSFRYIKINSIFEVSATYAEISLSCLVIFLGYRLFFILLVVLIVRSIMFILLCIKVFKIIPVEFPKLKNLKDYLMFSIPTIPGNISNWLVSTSDRLLIGFFLGASYSAYYSPGYALGQFLPFGIAAILGYYLTPLYSEIYSKNAIEDLIKINKLIIKYFLIFSIPYFFGSIILSKEILLLLTTLEIANNGHSIVFLSASSSIFFGLSVIIGQFLILKKMTKLSGSFWIIAALINITGNLLLIPVLGIIAAAITTVISYFLVFFCNLIFVSKYFALKVNIIEIIKIIICSLIMALSVFLGFIYYPLGKLHLIFFGIFLYFILAFFARIISKDEVIFIKQILKNKKLLSGD